MASRLHAAEQAKDLDAPDPAGREGPVRVRVQVTDNRNGATAEGVSSFRVAR
ncbi:MAG: hypothetical protein HYS34_05870 [Acidobacteria bacterium]|nr:hypothetical protein [Acidobacteriota bacterium]